MKRLFLASDIHGSYSATKSIIEAYEREQCDKLILLGDLYYHGPRNPLPDEYCPKKVAELLNAYADKLIVIKGNCDAEVDQMISEFPFVSRKVLHSFGRNIFLTHGHLYNSDNMPKLNVGDVLCYGH
ncbi:MAG: phosphodiesterase, partial [Clostridia bacterium]